MLRRHSGSSSQSHLKPFILPTKNTSRKDENTDIVINFSAVKNRQALESGVPMTIKRLPFLPFFTVPTEKLHQQFKSPCEQNRTHESKRLLQVKTLGMRRRWSGSVLKPLIKHDLPPVQLEDLETLENIDPNTGSDTIVEEISSTAVENQPPPLVLWTSETDSSLQVVVPEIVGKFLRPHQREGVQFMFDCVCQVRGFDGQGCILADDMGLGKTLQSITLMYTLMQCSMSTTNAPIIRRAIVVCPTSLVKNWDDEITKWLHGRVQTIALFEANREVVVKGIRQFVEGSKHGSYTKAAQVLVISYETFRMHAQRFIDVPSACDLLICDEAHRLKNANSQINKALSSLACRKRVLLSGTPMQNDLEEFYAMVEFTNPMILGTPNSFRKEYLNPILIGREPDSTGKEREKAQTCSAMLCEIVNQFILRRGNILNAKHLPPKLMQVICCPLSPLQVALYNHFLTSTAYRDMMKKERSTNVLSSITALKKLCNHPLLIFDEHGKSTTKLEGFEGCAQIFAEAVRPTNINGEGRRTIEKTCHPEWSGKMLLLDRLMLSMRKTTTDRIVIVSNYTQTLDVVSTLCRERHLPFVRLDGTTSAKKRKQLVDVFNDPTTNSFAFLLSSKAGGCGLNLIGANRLVLFDPDWNPATDKQAAARVWREGQKKMCFVYRFLATGTLEEKIFQRQLSKEGLQNIVDDKEEVNSLSSKDLKRLFVFRTDTMSDTHDQLKCERCKWHNQSNISEEAPETVDNEDESMIPSPQQLDYHPQIGMPPEEDLNNWGHHRLYESVDDEVMQSAIQGLRSDLVSFAFSCRVDWQLLQDFHMGNEEEENQKEEERKRKRMEKIRAAKAQALEANKPKAKKNGVTKKNKAKYESESEVSDSCSSDDEDDFIKDDVEDPLLQAASDDSDVEILDMLPPQSQPPRIEEKDQVTIPKKPRLRFMLSDDDEEDDDDFDFDLGQLGKNPRVISVPSTTDLGSSSRNEHNLIDNEEMKEDESVSQSSQGWSCSRCTLLNAPRNDICGGCGLRFRRSRLQRPQTMESEE